MILLFENVHRVMRAEAALKRAGIPYEILPTPKELSAECGMCLEVAAAELAGARAALGDLAVTVAEEVVR